MNDELPEPLRQLSPPAAPRELRVRTLAAVNRELAASRRPRWERVLELSVAATFLIGVGLNAQLISSGLDHFMKDGRPSLLDFDPDAIASHDAESLDAPTESCEASYARYLAQLSANNAG